MKKKYEYWILETIIGSRSRRAKHKVKNFSPAPNHFGGAQCQYQMKVCTGQPELCLFKWRGYSKSSSFDLRLALQSIPLVLLIVNPIFILTALAIFRSPIWKSHCYWVQWRRVEGEMKTLKLTMLIWKMMQGCLNISHFAGIDYNRAGVPLVELSPTVFCVLPKKRPVMPKR